MSYCQSPRIFWHWLLALSETICSTSQICGNRCAEPAFQQHGLRSGQQRPSRSRGLDQTAHAWPFWFLTGLLAVGFHKPKKRNNSKGTTENVLLHNKYHSASVQDFQEPFCPFMGHLNKWHLYLELQLDPRWSRLSHSCKYIHQERESCLLRRDRRLLETPENTRGLHEKHVKGPYPPSPRLPLRSLTRCRPPWCAPPLPLVPPSPVWLQPPSTLAPRSCHSNPQQTPQPRRGQKRRPRKHPPSRQKEDSSAQLSPAVQLLSPHARTQASPHGVSDPANAGAAQLLERQPRGSAKGALTGALLQQQPPAAGSGRSRANFLPPETLGELG